MSVAEWRQKTVAELKQVLKDLLRQQFKLRLKKSSGELQQTHQVKQVRRDIARVMTLLTQKEGKE
jgi:large subunit ribosomal protein L29